MRPRKRCRQAIGPGRTAATPGTGQEQSKQRHGGFLAREFRRLDGGGLALTLMVARAPVAIAGPAATSVSELATMRQPSSLVDDSRREARLTASPMAVNSTRRSVPRLPTTALPLWMPMPMAKVGRPRSGKRASSHWRKDSAAAAISRAAAIARRAWSGWCTGEPNTAITASPMNLSTLPPWASTGAQARGSQALSISKTSRLVSFSDMAVKLRCRGTRMVSSTSVRQCRVVHRAPPDRRRRRRHSGRRANAIGGARALRAPSASRWHGPGQAAAEQQRGNGQHRSARNSR